MESWTIDTYLDRLAAARPPTPAGGVVAALAVAQGAALLTMVAEIVGEPAGDVGARAGLLQERALALGEADMRLFDAVMAAVALPRETGDERARRSAAVTAALVAAAGPPAEVVVLGGEVVELAEQLATVAGTAIVADVAAAAEAAAAGVAISRTNVESNLRGADGPETVRLRALVEPVDSLLARAATMRAEVRRRVRTG
jgi:formiminotetrahydrofolate cyclodeaminase